MERNVWLYRAIFLLIACVATVSYEFSTSTFDALTAFLIGLAKGLLVFGLLIGCEASLKKVSFRSFNTTLIGILVGTLMGYVAGTCLQTLFALLGVKPVSDLAHLTILFTYLSSLYIGINATYSLQEVWWLNIPFVQLQPAAQGKKKEILVDLAALEDSRLTDLARLGLLDNQLVVPNFLVKEIQKSMESTDEAVKTRYRKSFEQLKRLESMPALNLEVKDFQSSDLDDLPAKFISTAKLTHAHILTSEPNGFKLSEEEGLILISLEAIANAIKPSAQRGEILTIKIQRPGKEPKQGVGYLEDGTMVVVNGGGDFLGETIKTQVLSQKYSSSGKIIFCNALNEDGTVSPAPFLAGPTRDDAVAQLSRMRRDFATPVQDRSPSGDSWNRH